MYSVDEKRLVNFYPAINTIIETIDVLRAKADADWTCDSDKDAMNSAIVHLENAEFVLLQRFRAVVDCQIGRIQDKQRANREVDDE